MKLSKRLIALFLMLTMFMVSVPLGAINALALEGMGPPTDLNYYARGVDISYWQAGDSTGKNVDFSELKASGCEFVILRLGYGQSVDKAFVAFYNKARAAGMPLGVYMYGLKTTKAGAASDAAWAISVFEQYDMYFEYPIFYDIEESDQIALSSANATALCEGWCDTLKASNYFPGIYSGTQFYNKLSSSFKQNNDLWIARVLSGAGSEWSSQFTYTDKKYNEEGYTMWQYSWSNIYNGSYIYNGVYSSGTKKVDALDLDVCYKDYPSIMKANGYNNCQSSAKPALWQSILAAKELRYSSFDADGLTTLRQAYDNAVAVYNSATSTESDYKTAKTTLDNAMVCSGTTVLSKGCSYTTNVTARTDFPDENSKLTDGIKTTTSVVSTYSTYAAYYHTGDVEITVDLGAQKNSNIYTAYVASEFWGVPIPNNMTVSYSNSASGPFTQVDGKVAVQTLGNGDSVDGIYNSVLSSMTISTDTAISARYIKFALNVNNYVWVDEVEVSSGNPLLSGGIYLTGANSFIESGDCHIYTSGFGTITVSNANHAYTINAIAEHQGDGTFVIKSVEAGKGTDTADITLTDSQILIAAHNWETGVTNGTQIVGSAENANRLNSLQPGDIIVLDGVTIYDAVYFDAAPYIRIISTSSDDNNEQEHVHTPGAEASCTTSQVCLDCGEILDEAPGHTASDWAQVEDVLIRLCIYCGETLEVKRVDDENVDTGKTQIGLRGDINQNGKIDASDYFMLKSVIFGKHELNEVTVLLADVNENGTIESSDYFMLKSVCFGKYELTNPYVYN